MAGEHVGSKIRKTKPRAGATVRGACLCGAVVLEIGVPAVWAWHDHSAASRRAQGAAYATYVGSWKSKFAIVEGEDLIASYRDPDNDTVRRFCSRCGTPLMYERPRAPKMVNVPRALFGGRTGREPRYHVGIDQMAEWIYAGTRLVPLKGYPGVVWERPKSRKKRPDGEPPE